MDFTIEEYNEEVHLTIIEETDTLEFSIEEIVEELNIVIEEYHGADGVKGDKPNHQWNGTSLRFENPDDTWGNYVDLKGDKGDYGGGLMSVVAGDNIIIDNTDPLNPIINAEDGGTTVTKTSDIINDGEDGINPYISLNDIPVVDVSTKAETDASNLSAPNVISWRDALNIYSKSQVDGFVSTLDSKITTEKNRNDTQDGRITANENAIATKQDKSLFSAIQDKWIHYYDLATEKFQPILHLVSGVVNQLEFSGRIKADAIVLPNNTNPVVANRLRSDGTYLYFADSSGVERRIPFFEHQVRGKRFEATGVTGNYSIDLNAGSHFSLTLSGNTVFSFSNMIASEETCAITLTITGAFTIALPAWLIIDAYSDVVYNNSKAEINIVIKKGGSSPTGRYTMINM